MMKTTATLLLSSLFTFGLGLCPAPRAEAQDAPPKLVAVTTLPYLAHLVREVGGDQVDVQALVPPGQDPHFMVPTPALSVLLAQADLMVETGMQLELWTERVIDGARNQKIRPGNPGHLYASQGVTPLQVPSLQTRASGDVHPAGNPHVWLDPLNLKIMARNIEARLTALRPAAETTFARNREAFERRLDDAYYGPELVRILGASLLDRLQRTGRLRAFLQEKQLQGKPMLEQAGGWFKRSIALGDLSMITYHQVWTYFVASFGFRVVGTIEEKPGIPPSPSHLQELQQVAQQNHTRLVECSPFYPLSRAEAVAEQIGGVALQLPTEPGEADGATDLFSMFDVIFARLEAAAAVR